MLHVKLTVKWTASNADSANESCDRAELWVWVCWLVSVVGASWAAVGLFAVSKFDVTDVALAELTDRAGWKA